MDSHPVLDTGIVKVRILLTPWEAWQIGNALSLISEGMLVQIQPFPPLVVFGSLMAK